MTMHGILARFSAFILTILLLVSAAFSEQISQGIDRPSSQSAVSRQPSLCKEVENPAVRLSRPTLDWLRNVPINSNRYPVMERLGAPYCFAENRNDVLKVVYPCEWDTATWIIVTYHRNQYKGYDFSFGDRELSDGD